VRDWGRRFKQYGIWVVFILFMGVPAFGRYFGMAVYSMLRALDVDLGLVAIGRDGMNILGR
jgi:hypothetical protein